MGCVLLADHGQRGIRSLVVPMAVWFVNLYGGKSVRIKLYR